MRKSSKKPSGKLPRSARNALLSDVSSSPTAQADKYKCTRQAVYYWHQRKAAGLTSANDMHRSGRPPLLTPEDKDYIRKRASKGDNAPEIRKALGSNRNKHVSLSTIYNVLRSGRRPRKWMPVKNEYTIRDVNKKNVSTSVSRMQTNPSWGGFA